MGFVSSRASTAEATASEAPFSSAETEAAGSEALWLAAPEEAAEEAEEDAEEAEPPQPGYIESQRSSRKDEFQTNIHRRFPSFVVKFPRPGRTEKRRPKTLISLS